MRTAVITLLLLACGCAGKQGGPTTSAAANGHGPTTRASTQAPAPQVSRAPDIQTAIARGLEYLKKTQNPDGSWGKATETRGYEVYSMVPGTHDGMKSATTALCVMALRELGETEAHAKGVEFLLTSGRAYRDTSDLIYNIWAHTYTLQALSIEIRLAKAAGQPIDERMTREALWHLDRLKRYETVVGGWNYYDFEVGTQTPAMEPTSFGTASGLIALHEARQAGLDVPQVLIDRAHRRLAEMRLPNGAYLYSSDHRYAPRHPANMVRGSVGRSQACNYALWLLKNPRVDSAKVREGLEMFGTEHAYIRMGRKRQFPHESWYATAPYYYYYGHYHAALAVEALGPDGRKDFGAVVAEGILPYQEPDGSWWDYAMWGYHKPYGTAYSLMTLRRCQQ